MSYPSAINRSFRKELFAARQVRISRSTAQACSGLRFSRMLFLRSDLMVGSMIRGR